MKVLGVFILAGLLLVPVFYASWWAGRQSGRAAATRNAIRALGFTDQSARRYADAMRLLNRMVRHIDLDGDFAADILSEPTRHEAERLVADYRKEIDK